MTSEPTTPGKLEEQNVDHISVYLLNSVPPSGLTPVFASNDIEVSLHSGPLEFQVSRMQLRLAPPSAGMIGAGHGLVSIPSGSYLLIRQPMAIGASTEERVQVELTADETAGLLEQRYEGMVVTRQFSDFVVGPGQFMFSPPTWVRLIARPVIPPEMVASALRDDLTRCGTLDTAGRSRLRLAARWFAAGAQSPNPIDRFLSLWTALEVLVGSESSTKTSNLACDFLIARMGLELLRPEVKARTRLGRIEGCRGDIVHQGIAYPDSDMMRRLDDTDALRIVVVTCLRLVGGLIPGDEIESLLRGRK